MSKKPVSLHIHDIIGNSKAALEMRSWKHTEYCLQEAIHLLEQIKDSLDLHTWHPIETASQDHMGILLYDPDMDEGYGIFSGRINYTGDPVTDDYQITNATHWRPFPSPPR